MAIDPTDLHSLVADLRARVEALEQRTSPSGGPMRDLRSTVAPTHTWGQLNMLLGAVDDWFKVKQGSALRLRHVYEAIIEERQKGGTHAISTSRPTPVAPRHPGARTRRRRVERPSD